MSGDAALSFLPKDVSVVVLPGPSVAHPSALVGEAAEHRLIAELLLRGCGELRRPVIDCGVDLWVGDLSVQVKAASKRPALNQYVFNAKSFSKADVYVFHGVTTLAWWVVPCVVLRDLGIVSGNVSLPVTAARVSGRGRPSRLGIGLEPYRDAWHVLGF